MRGRLAWLGFAAGCLLFMLGPLAVVVASSFGQSALIGSFAEGLSLRWYREVMQDPAFRQAVLTSLLIAGSVSVLATAIGTMTAIALSRAGGGWAQTVLAALSLPVILPPLVVAIAIVVLFVRGIGLGLGVPVVIAAHVMLTQPFVVMIVLARLRNFDHASMEAARDVGATAWQAFRLVMLPQLGASIVGAALICAAVSLDDFIVASFTLGGGNTLSTFVWGKLRTTLDPSVNAVASVLLVLTISASAAALRLTGFRGQ